jgi:hypothetical protein
LLIRLLLFQQLRRDSLVKRILQELGYLAPQVFVSVFLEQLIGLFIDYGCDFETAAHTELDVLAVSEQ